jgi:magnesium-dependent phosphatase-1
MKRKLSEVERSPISWKVIALALLTTLRDASQLVVCFDLDNTLWPTCGCERTSPPYVAAGDKFSVFHSNLGERFRVFENSCEIVKWCHEQGIQISICSKSNNHQAVRGILEALDLWKCFKFPQIYNKRKSVHFRMLTGK